MSQQIKKVAIAGATGNLGPAIVNALDAAGFDVTILTRTAEKGGKHTTKVVDYTSSESLTAALQGQDAVVSTLGAPALAGQQLLIDAAVAAGVKRFIPSEFGSDTTDAYQREHLPQAAFKIAIQKHLNEVVKTSPMTYSLIINGPFFDWGLNLGFLLVRKDRTATLIDGGDTVFTSTLLKDIGIAVAGTLKHPAETVNRAVYVASTVTTQNKIIAAAERSGLTGWKTQPGTAEGLRQLGIENRKKDPANVMSWLAPTIQGNAIFDHGHSPELAVSDNELTGVKLLTDAEFDAVVKKAFS